MSTGMPVVQLPSPGLVGGRPRKEGVYDTEVLVGGSAIGTSITLFQDFSSFASTPNNSFKKKTGRDTNLTGGGTRGLPKNHHLFWYEWRAKLRPLNSSLASADNSGVLAQILLYQQMTSVSYNFTQTTLIQTQLDELPAGVGPAWGYTTHTDTAIFGPNCVPTRKGKVVTITGKPVSINELQSFEVELKTPEGSLTPTVDIFVTVFLEGLLIRGIVG